MKNVEKKKIIITGTTGFLGSRISRYFESYSDGYDDSNTNDNEKKNRYQVYSPTHSELEITELENVMSYFQQVQPDILVHCAAISDVGKCDEDVEKSYAINVTGVENLAKACAACGTKMVFCSSDQIYFEKKEKSLEAEHLSQGEESQTDQNIEQESVTDKLPIFPHRESEEVLPCNTYGRQKLEAEQKTLAICPDAVCLRLSWMYDTEQLLENEHGNFYRNVKATLERGEACRFPTHDVRGITYVGSVVENLPKVFLLPGGVYNYGAENSMNTYELVKALFEKVGIPGSAIQPNEEAFTPGFRNISMNIDKLRKAGIDFTSTLEELTLQWR